MKITEISASFGYTMQLKSYHPAKFFTSLKAEVQEGEDIEASTTELYKIARQTVKNEISAIERSKDEMLKKESVEDKIKKLKQ